MVQEASREMRVSAHPAACGKLGSGMSAPLGKILVVDDDREILDMLTDHLEDEGYAVSQAVDGEQALESVRSEPPDLVLLDVTMPGVSGLEVLRRLRLDHPRIPVVMITGIEDETLARSTLKMGAFDYLQKPFDPYRLSGLVLAAIGAAFDLGREDPGVPHGTARPDRPAE
jgi:DNA-binding response OmpR family regulator